jgi:hypothetical protein
MALIAVTLRMYANVLGRTARAAVRNWRLALVTPLYLLIMATAASVFAPLGPQLGGLALGLVQAACFSLYLHLLAEAVRDGGRVMWRDFVHFGSYFWSVIRILFLFYIVGFFVRPMIGNSEGAALYYILRLFAAVALNALPEMIYIEREEALGALSGSVRFIQQNWIEWFAPVLIGGWLLVLLDPWAWMGLMDLSHLGHWGVVLNPLHQIEVVAGRVAFLKPGVPRLAASGLLSVLVLYLLLLLRGFLFRALTEHSQRTRLYRHRMGLD